jgi:hypothetical protein
MMTTAVWLEGTQGTFQPLNGMTAAVRADPVDDPRLRMQPRHDRQGNKYDG